MNPLVRHGTPRKPAVKALPACRRENVGGGAFRFAGDFESAESGAPAGIDLKVYVHLLHVFAGECLRSDQRVEKAVALQQLTDALGGLLYVRG